jgi:hypothetical protein
VKVDSLMYYNMSEFHFIILISQFMRAIFRAAHNFWEPLYMLFFNFFKYNMRPTSISNLDVITNYDDTKKHSMLKCEYLNTS